jgi:histidine triad (HIT) family protein
MEPRKHDHPTSCTFCELIQGSAEVSICYEDSDAIAFMDIQPVNNGHVLVVPREHHESLLDVPEELGVHLFKATMRIANAIRHVTGCEDMNIVVNSGAAAGQDEPHYHVHIIPRRADDGFDIPLPFNGSEMPDRTILDAYAVQIIAALRDPMRTSGSRSSGSGSGDVAEQDGEASMQAAPVRRVTKEWRADRAVDLAVFSDTATPALADAPEKADTPSEGYWPIGEGAHGELRYERATDSANH